VTSIIMENKQCSKESSGSMDALDSGIHETATWIALCRTKDNDDKIGCFCLIRLAQMRLACLMFHFHKTSTTFPGQHIHCLQAKGLCARGQRLVNCFVEYPNLSQKREFQQSDEFALTILCMQYKLNGCY
jgi:hypothetical protein